jgi:hypothetical protein
MCSKSCWLCLSVVYWLLECNKVPSLIEPPEYTTIPCLFLALGPTYWCQTNDILLLTKYSDFEIQCSHDSEMTVLSFWVVMPHRVCRQMPTFQRNILSLSLAPAMETVCFSETLVPTYELTGCHDPEHHHHHQIFLLLLLSSLTTASLTIISYLHSYQNYSIQGITHLVPVYLQLLIHLHFGNKQHDFSYISIFLLFMPPRLDTQYMNNVRMVTRQANTVKPRFYIYWIYIFPSLATLFRFLQLQYIHNALFSLILCFQNFKFHAIYIFRVLTEETVLT